MDTEDAYIKAEENLADRLELELGREPTEKEIADYVDKHLEDEVHDILSSGHPEH